MLFITFSIFTLVIVTWLQWRRKQFSVFKELGIPGPKPNLFSGNFWEISEKTPLLCHKEWAKKYGKIFGYYLGLRPIVVVGDVDLLKKIQISDFHTFINRPDMHVFKSSKPDKDDGCSYQLTNLRDMKWKQMRSILTPSFTTRKLRLMSPAINTAIDTMIDEIEEKSKKNEIFDIYKLYQALTMDIIGRTAFGINTDCQRNPNDPFLRSARAHFVGGISKWVRLFAVCFPELGLILKCIMRVKSVFMKERTNPKQELLDSIKMIVKKRRSDEANRRDDLLQLMIDAQMSDSEINSATGRNLTAGDEADEESEKKSNSKGNFQTDAKIIHSMEDYEILHNALLFFLAGYETTSTHLAFTTHFLVHFPVVQEKIREEVERLIQKEGKLDYRSVQELQYMDQVLQETLRVYPPLYLSVNRETNEDIQVGNLRLKKGLDVQVPSHLIQHDEDYWTDPEKFDPDRFSYENTGQFHRLAFQAFGAGPRNCIGMRFAQMETKLTLAKMLHKFKLVPCEETDKLDLALKVSSTMIAPKNGVNLRAVPVM